MTKKIRQLTYNGGDKRKLAVDKNMIVWLTLTSRDGASLFTLEGNQVKLITKNYNYTDIRPSVSQGAVAWMEYNVRPYTSIMKYETGQDDNQPKLVATIPDRKSVV